MKSYEKEARDKKDGENFEGGENEQINTLPEIRVGGICNSVCQPPPDDVSEHERRRGRKSKKKNKKKVHVVVPKYQESGYDSDAFDMALFIDELHMPI